MGFASVAPETGVFGDHTLLGHFHAAHDVLLNERDLSPANPKVNACLSAFVRAVLACPGVGSDDILAAPGVRVKRQMLLPKLSAAEYEMELFYARKLAARDVLTDDDLNTFIYRKNYDELVREEISAARAVNALPNAKPVVFVGSGPLPLSAIDMHKQTGLPVICVDSDPVAIDVSRRIVMALGLGDAIQIVESNGEEFDYSGAGLVMVAALVAAKDTVLNRIREMAPRAAVAVRSAEGVRTLLYDDVNPDGFNRAGYTYAGKSDATSTIINTTLFFHPNVQVCNGAAMVEQSRRRAPVLSLIA